MSRYEPAMRPQSRQKPAKAGKSRRPKIKIDPPARRLGQHQSKQRQSKATMASKATQIVADWLTEWATCGVGWDMKKRITEQFWTIDDAFNTAMNDMEWVAEDDDGEWPDWFPIIATPDIRKRVDWGYVVEQVNDRIADDLADLLFEDD